MSEANEASPASVTSGVERLVRCIGLDNKQHLCLPESDSCYCGVGVKRKKRLRDDGKLYSCWDCDIGI